MSVIREYIEKCNEIVRQIKAQEEQIQRAAEWFAKTILTGRMVHVFGSGHSRIMVEEMWPRYGSFPGFNPIVELSLTYHNAVVGANGQRQAMYIENTAGLAQRILRNFDVEPSDTALIISSSGCSVVPIEMAELFQSKGVKVVSIVTKKHSMASQSNREDGKKLIDFSDLVLDTGAPVGDALIYIENLSTPVSPGSTVGGTVLINCLKAQTAELLTQAGSAPKVLTSSALIGRGASKDLFEEAYDEHARRLAKLYITIGQK